VAQQYSIHRDPKKHPQPYKPNEFNPFYEPPKPRPLTQEMLNELFRN